MSAVGKEKFINRDTDIVTGHFFANCGIATQRNCTERCSYLSTQYVVVWSAKEEAAGNSFALPFHHLSVSLALTPLGGWVPVWRSWMIDSSICVCVITAGLIGREEHWDFVITDTPGQPLTHADTGWDSPLHSRSYGAVEEEGLCEGVPVFVRKRRPKMTKVCFYNKALCVGFRLLVQNIRLMLSCINFACVESKYRYSTCEVYDCQIFVLLCFALFINPTSFSHCCCSAGCPFRAHICKWQ